MDTTSSTRLKGRSGLLELRPEEVCRPGEQGEAPFASEAVRRIDMLFEIERSINGKTPKQWLAVRREQS
jgi:transposase